MHSDYFARPPKFRLILGICAAIIMLGSLAAFAVQVSWCYILLVEVAFFLRNSFRRSKLLTAEA
jgi:hypothetical protein